MEEILLEIQRTNDAFRWVLVGVWLTDVFALLATVWVGMMVREVRREVEMSRREVETGRREAEENSRKVSYYLFRKFGPIELP